MGIRIKSGTTYFAALGGRVGLLVLVGAHAEVLDGLARVALAAEEDGVRTSRSTHRELVEGQSLAASLQDALLGGSSEAECRNRQLGDLQQTHIVRDCSNGDDGFRVAIRCA